MEGRQRTPDDSRVASRNMEERQRTPDDSRVASRNMEERQRTPDDVLRNEFPRASVVEPPIRAEHGSSARRA
jgi:hypothetical protein